MKLRFAFPLVTFLLILVSSCKKNNKEGRYIPSTAHAAVHINLPSLSSKLSWSEIKSSDIFKDAFNTDSVWIKNLLDSPAASGIDIDKGIVFFIQKENNGGYVAIEGKIKDETAFKTLFSRLNNNGNITEIDGINYSSHYPSCTGWNNEHFISIIDAPHLQKMDDLNRRMQRDSIDISDYSQRDILKTCKSIFALEEKQSLAVDEKFSALLKEQGDAHVWVNTADIFKNTRLPGMLSLVNLEKFYSESVTTAAINFENGSIKINAHNYSNAELSKIYEKYNGGKVSEDMLKRLPGNDMTAVLAINFKPEALLEIAKAINLDGIINGAAPVLGFNTNDFIKANKGDIVLGIADLKMVNDSITPNETDMPFAVTKPVFNATLAASVNDKNSFDKLIAAGKKAGNAFINDEQMPFAYKYDDKYFVFSNTQANADAFSSVTNNREFISKISGSPVAGFLNFQSLIKGFETIASKDSSGKQVLDLVLKTWDNITLKGGNFANGALNYTAEINMVDKNTNSLKQLKQFITALKEMSDRQKRKEKEDMRAMEDALAPLEEPAKK